MKNSRNRTDSLLHAKSYVFALRIIRMTKFLRENKQEFILSKQILRSGTAIGALVRESEFAQSRPDFINKLSVALKEANETDYWLNLLKDSDYIANNSFDSIDSDCGELIALLISSIKTVKNNMNAG
ncbi:tIGR02436 family protein [Bacteroides clarus CAG:160]|jgi:four helix bundle protein|uniref:TIGR02436 family protein n=1 Tax=Bacteroides clarus YIT 12056 TaxID=762984 RepID=A0ABN0CNC1_9BACE|nr:MULTISPECIES: four helix bundle protein [Bacteroides]EGF51743.1 TIGR02436 family protein [Bacteroides clarus YIT 12056]CDB84106.1 tIGR02436 family protein [Bacteroides clarus CAG:160]SHH19967.1 four helix bundle protein [Bacteroides clarus YIT 12056]HJF97925.1 four helix bundle protein [Bacteroides clarus]